MRTVFVCVHQLRADTQAHTIASGPCVRQSQSSPYFEYTEKNTLLLRLSIFEFLRKLKNGHRLSLSWSEMTDVEVCAAHDLW